MDTDSVGVRRVGVVNLNTRPSMVLVEAYQHAQLWCRKEFNCSVPLLVNDMPAMQYLASMPTDEGTPYVDMHLYFVFFEVLKNALQASLRHGRGDAAAGHPQEIPPVSATMVSGTSLNEENERMVRISDSGWGVPRDDVNKARLPGGLGLGVSRVLTRPEGPSASPGQPGSSAVDDTSAERSIGTAIARAACPLRGTGARGRHALAKLGRGDCPAGVVAAHTLLSSPRRRSHGDHKWLLEGAGAEHGEDGSATRCVVRSDHHPQRFLCARGAVELVSGARDESRLWEIEYLHDHPLRTDAVKPPFRLRSLGKPGRPYLVVDADLGGVALQSERPATLWEFFDAAGSTASLQVTFARSLSGSLCRDESPVRRAPSAVAEAWQLKQVSGSLEDVLSAQPDTQDGARAYSAPEVFFSIGEALCNATEIAQPPSTLYGVYAGGLPPNLRSCESIPSAS
ncbi:unnamed protein product [Prorocentrum cordatum]|uniref:Protein-serine/threonine kinase n=1 Tax=Prorocentrum cordatum TaxID=2364126 RepID=A0ABN9XLH1_9DINO|nr:unnamed protein product [Polarella glacialis]